MSSVETAGKRPAKVEAGVKLRGAEKVARIPVKIIPTDELPKKPDWIRVRIPVSPEVDQIKQTLRKHKLHSVCEEASCPNLGECFSSGTATFMIIGAARSATSATAGRMRWIRRSRRTWPRPSPTCA
jgi:lipoic acid synthetase